MKILKTIIILTLFFSCKNTNSTDNPKNPVVEVDTLVNEKPSESEDVWYFASVDKLRLRKESNKNAAVLEQVKEGGKLLFLNEKTDKKERVKLRDKWFEEPWLKVESEKGNVGWVYGGAVTTEVPKEEVSKLPYDKCEANYVKNKNQEARLNCIDKIANQQALKDARYIQPTSTGYKVTLLSGEPVNLVNEDGAATGSRFRQYTYLYYLDKIGYFVFRVESLEGASYILMDDKFGYAIPVNGIPRLSPDMKKLLISNADQGEGFEFNGVQLFAITDEGLSQNPVFDENVERYQPVNPVWIDEKTVEFDYLPFASEANSRNLKAKLVEREAGGVWDLRLVNRRE